MIWRRLPWAVLATVVLLGSLLSRQATAQIAMTAHHHLVVARTVTTQARAATTARRYLLLMNDSANRVYCTVDDQAATTTSGIRLEGRGTTGDRMEFMGANVPQGAISCISATGGDAVLITEGR